MNDDKTEEIKRNILSPAAWIRILYMAFYAVACWVLLFVLPVIIVCQIIISLITGLDNSNLRDFGKALADYFHQAVKYLVYATDEKPWPFSDGKDLGGSFEDEDDSVDDIADVDVVYEEPETAPPSYQPDTPRAAAASSKGDDVFSDISFTDEADNDTVDDYGDDNVDDIAPTDDDKKNPV